MGLFKTLTYYILYNTNSVVYLYSDNNKQIEIMTKQEILDLPIGKHLATDTIGYFYTIESDEEHTIIQFGNQRIYINDKRFGLLVGSVELSGVVSGYTFEKLTLLK